MAKIFRLCLLLLLFPSPGARANEALRAVVAGLECPAATFAVRDGRELAAALERTLRQSPGGGDLCVTWIDRAAPPFAGGGWSAELVALPARRLLAEVCANAGVFWGFRHGGIALSARGLRVTETFPFLPSGGSLFCCKDEFNSPLLYPTPYTSIFARLAPQATWRPGQEPGLLFMERDDRMSVIAAEDDLPTVREAVRSGVAWSEPNRVLISATWIVVPTPTPLNPEAPLDGPEVRRLLRAGKARVLNHQAVAILSGINAVLETVDEVIYPTQFDGTDEEYGWMTGPGPFMVPTAFETREVGSILNVTPTVMIDKTIALQLLPELCQLAGWQTLGQRPPPGKPHHQAVLRVPKFRSLNLTTSLLTRDDGELVQKMGRDPATGDLILLHVHVRLLNADGTPRNPS